MFLYFKNILSISVLAFALVLSAGVSAADKAEDLALATDKKVEESKQNQTAEKRKEILSDATAALRETQNALKSLDDNQPQAALDALERAVGKLNIIIARDPSLALAASGVNAVTYDVLASLDAVKNTRKEAEDALKQGRVQQARRLISTLASETVISTTHIPLGTYPDAIKLAVSLIDEGKLEDAKRVLQTALSTLVVTDVVVPLPIVASEALLKQAESLAENAARSDSENQRLASLLDAARTELEFAQVLGYGKKKDFENLYEQITQIETKTKDGKSGKGFFKRIKGFLKDTVDSSQPDANDKQ